MEVLQPRSVRWVYSSTSAAPYAEYSKKTDLNLLHSTITLAHAATTSGRNDVVFLTPETHTLTAAVTWSNSSTHLIGMQPNKYANGVLVTHTDALSINNMLTVSGSNNIFENIHFRHGVGTQAANLTCLNVTGDGNLFKNCWFEGPCDSSVGDLTTGRLITLAGANNTFQNCHIGATWIARTGAGSALLEYTNTTYEATFEDCTFNTWIGATTPCFIYVKTGKAQMMQYYKNCQFYSTSTNKAYTMGAALIFQGDDATGQHHFDSRCQFYGVTYIVGAQVNPRLNTYFGIAGDTGGGATIGRAITTT